MPNLTIALAVSVVPVGPRNADIKAQDFALHVSAAFAPPDMATPELEYLAHPWEWKEIPRVWIKTATVAEPAFEGIISGTERKPLAVLENLTRLQELIIEGKDPAWNPVQVQTPASNTTAKKNEANLIEAVHTLSLYPGEIPQKSKTVFYFKSQGWSAGTTMFAAAPQFVIRLKGSGTEIEFRPRGDFDLAQAAGGWEYVATVLSGSMPAGLTIAAKAYVKPLAVAPKTGYVQYDEDPTFTVENVPFGANFKDYWFRSIGVYPWTEKLADFNRSVTDMGAIMSQMRVALETESPQVRDAWDNLRLMALALYAQWFVPTAMPTDCAIVPNDAVGLVAALKAQQVLASDAEADELNRRLQLLDQELRTGERRREIWLDIFRRAFGLESLTQAQLLQRAAEKAAQQAERISGPDPAPDVFDLLLFHQWDYAVEKYEKENVQQGTPLFRDEWKKRTREAAVVKESIVKLFTDTGQAGQLWGTRRLKKIYGDCVNARIMRTSTLDDARTILRAQLKTLRSLLDSDLSQNYHPRLTSRGELAADWNRLWQRWDAFVDSYVNQLVNLPDTEAKPGGLTLQFDLLREKQTGVAPLDDPNFWKKLAGIGVLVREVSTPGGQPTGDWRSVSAATLNLRGIRIRKVEATSDPRKIIIEVEVPKDARQGLYNLTLGLELFGYDLKLLENSFTLTGKTATTPQITVDIDPANTSSQAFRAKLIMVRTDKDFDPAALQQVVFGKLLVGAALVPVRVPYRDGLRHPYITYNQRSLIAPSDLANAVRDSFKVTEVKSALQLAGLYEYGPAWNGNPNFNLVPLKFGRKYEMAAFMIDTAGGLPAELSSGAPWVFNDQSLNVPSNAATRQAVVKTYDYWRKVPVGQVRITALKETGNATAPAFLKKPWPEIPDGVAPLAWEVKRPDEPQFDPLNPQSDPQQNPKVDPRAKERKSQLALLYDGKDEEGADTSAFAFGIKPPAIDLDVLERWSATPDELTRLRQVMKEYFMRLALRKGDPTPLQIQDESDDSLDITFDDPAVRHILFILEKYDFDEANQQLKWKVTSWHAHEVIRDNTLPGIGYYQTGWLKVLCRGTRAGDVPFSVTDADAEAKARGFDITVAIPRDQVHVVRLRVCAAVDRKFVNGAGVADPMPKFDTGFFELTHAPDYPQAYRFKEDVINNYNLGSLPAMQLQRLTEFLNKNVCLKPFTTFLETPNQELPKDDELWRILKLELDAQTKDKVRVLLDQSVSVLKPKLRNVARYDVLKQVWRWQGRPIEKIKAVWTVDSTGTGPVRDNETEVLKWELSAFAETDEVRDTLTIPRPYNYHQPNPLLEDSYKTDLLSHYARYAVRVYSRYEKLFAALLPVTSKQVIPLTALQEKKLSGHGWRRVLIPYRGVKPPKPLIKAVLPLTRTYAVPSGDSDNAASLMLALDETMFSHCGVTELIECEVERVKILQPEQPLTCAAGPTRTMLHQAGPDPIITPIRPSDTALSPACELPNGDRAIRLDMVGPFGHTFDTGARMPLYGSSSLIVRPFQQDEDHHRFNPWNFVKIKFRRKSGNAAVDNTVDEKEWTQPLWVQFLPPSEFGVPSWDDDVTVELDKQSRRITLTPKSAQTFFSALDDTGMFQYCLVLTRLVQDYRGRRGQEIYVDYLRLKHVDSKKRLSGVCHSTTLFEGELRGRLLELQTSPRVDSTGKRFFDEIPADNLWEELLVLPENESKDPTDVKFRITRISSDFKVKM